MAHVAQLDIYAVFTVGFSVSIPFHVITKLPVLPSLSFTCTVHVSVQVLLVLGVYIIHVVHVQLHVHLVQLAVMEPDIIDQFQHAHSAALDPTLQSVVLAEVPTKAFHT